MKNMHRWITGAALAVSMALVLPFQAFAGQENWKHNENGWWYLKDDDTFCSDTWLEEDGFWYHFNSNGYMDTGWLEDKGQWYYLGEDGRMYVSTTKNIDGAAYMFDDTGASMGESGPGRVSGRVAGQHLCQYLGQLQADRAGGHADSQRQGPEELSRGDLRCGRRCGDG